MKRSEGMIAVVAAMPEEVALVRARMEAVEVRHLGGRQARQEVRIGRLDGTPVALLVTGDGERNARRGLAALLAGASDWQLEGLIVVGIAGALSSGLATADLVVATHVVQELAAGGLAASTRDGGLGRVAVAEPSWVDSAVRVLGARPAVVVTARRIADSALEKRRLLGLAAVDAAVEVPTAVVDLESAIFAELARAAGIPWLILRAVSDTASEDLPELLNRARDAGGAVRRTHVLRGLLTNPGAISQLLTLRGRLARCAEVLGAALRADVLRVPPRAYEKVDDVVRTAGAAGRPER